MIFPYRTDHLRIRHVKLAGDLGQTLLLPFRVLDDETIRKAVKHSNIVINLLGKRFETKNFSFEDVR